MEGRDVGAAEGLILLTALSSLEDFLRVHQLPGAYARVAARWFGPLARDLARHHAAAGRPLILGIHGSQGSGKSTLASLLHLLLGSVHGLRAIDLSIDGFYLTRDEREALARQVHPLLATRGVPGTHDTVLLARTLDALVGQSGMVSIPRFDKATDDRVSPGQWQQIQVPLDVVILEGWCLGTPPQRTEQLAVPVNELERLEDPDGSWRHYVNECLRIDYQPLFDRVDVWVMFRAPSFECVYQWRLEQEQKLAAHRAALGGAASRVMDPVRLARFVQHYQRLTEHALRVLPGQVHYLYRLDAKRRIVEAVRPRPVLIRT